MSECFTHTNSSWWHRYLTEILFYIKLLCLQLFDLQMIKSLKKFLQPSLLIFTKSTNINGGHLISISPLHADLSRSKKSDFCFLCFECHVFCSSQESNCECFILSRLRFLCTLAMRQRSLLMYSKTTPETFSNYIQVKRSLSSLSLLSGYISGSESFRSEQVCFDSAPFLHQGN